MVGKPLDRRTGTFRAPSPPATPPTSLVRWVPARAGCLEGRLGLIVVATLTPKLLNGAARPYDVKHLLPDNLSEREPYDMDGGKARAEAVVAQWLRRAGL